MNGKTLVTLFAVLLVAVVACAPKPTPPTPAATSAPRAAAPSPSAATPATAAGNDAWSKVTEAAKKEGAFTVYSFGFGPGDTIVNLSNAFKQKYGITVEFITGTGASLTERAITEARSGQHIASLFHQSEQYFVRLQPEGLIDSLADLPVLQEKDVWVRHPFYSNDMPAIVAEFSTVPLILNTRVIKPGDEPKTYMDLLDPKYKGKLGIDDPVTGTSVTLQYVLFKNHNALADADGFFSGLAKQDLKIVVSKPELYASVARGDVGIIFAGVTASSELPYIAQGAPVKLLGMKEGTFALSNTSYVLLKNAPSPNAAKLFVNWFLSQEGQTIYAKSKGVAPLRKDVPDSTPDAGRFEISKLIPGSFQDSIDVNRFIQQQYVAGLLGLKR